MRTKYKSKPLYPEVAGWYGVLAILFAYCAVSLGYLPVTNGWYHLLNITGAVGLVLDSVYQRDWQPMVLNIAWAFIGVISLL